MPYLSVPQAKYNALKKENEQLKALLSEDLVAENAKLKLKIWEMECALPKIKADAIREACRSNIAGSDSVGMFCYQAGLLMYADGIEAGK